MAVNSLTVEKQSWLIRSAQGQGGERCDGPQPSMVVVPTSGDVRRALGGGLEGAVCRRRREHDARDGSSRRGDRGRRTGCCCCSCGHQLGEPTTAEA